MLVQASLCGSPNATAAINTQRILFISPSILDYFTRKGTKSLMKSFEEQEKNLYLNNQVKNLNDVILLLRGKWVLACARRNLNKLNTNPNKIKDLSRFVDDLF
jgi:hypothetical protein